MRERDGVGQVFRKRKKLKNKSANQFIIQLTQNYIVYDDKKNYIVYIYEFIRYTFYNMINCIKSYLSTKLIICIKSYTNFYNKILIKDFVL